MKQQTIVLFVYMWLTVTYDIWYIHTVLGDYKQVIWESSTSYLQTNPPVPQHSLKSSVIFTIKQENESGSYWTYSNILNRVGYDNFIALQYLLLHWRNWNGKRLWSSITAVTPTTHENAVRKFLFCSNSSLDHFLSFQLKIFLQLKADEIQGNQKQILLLYCNHHISGT